MKLYIKNMVCNRCIAAVRIALEKMGLHIVEIHLGEVETDTDELNEEQHKELVIVLDALGFELIDDRKSRMIEKIKTVVINLVHYTAQDNAKQKYSDLIAKELHYDYPYLSKLFSDIEGITIEHYIIGQKVEKIKEYLVYEELSLGQIADRMGYSSTAHLSAQFKKATGLPPSHFKSLGVRERKPLDKTTPNS